MKFRWKISELVTYADNTCLLFLVNLFAEVYNKVTTGFSIILKQQRFNFELR